jgi:hypothetical protein
MSREKCGILPKGPTYLRKYVWSSLAVARQRLHDSSAETGAHVSTIEAEFSVWSARGLCKYSLASSCLPPEEGVSPCNSGMAKKENHQKKWDPGKLWIPEKGDRCRQKDVPPCSSGMVEKKPHQEYFDPGKSCMAEGICRRWNEEEPGRHRDVKELPHLRKERKTTNCIKGWSAGQRSYLGSRGTPSKNPYEIFGGKIMKQVVRTSRKLRRIRKWTLWSGRPSPKRKKKS